MCRPAQDSPYACRRSRPLPSGRRSSPRRCKGTNRKLDYGSGPLEARCKRAVEEYGDKPEDIQKTVKNIDKQRARYCQHYCDKAWEDAENYDLCLNSGTISLENCVAIVKSAYQELAK